MTKDEALKMAIDALDESMPLVFGNGVALEMMKTPLIEVEKKVNFHKKAINACKEALEPEPMTTTDVITCKMTGKCCMTGEALEQPLTRDWKHTIDERIARDSEFKEALEQPTWQGLTDDEITKVYDDSLIVHSDTHYEFNNFKFARAIEQALKDKNTKFNGESV
jgi:hypothetical protein